MEPATPGKITEQSGVSLSSVVEQQGAQLTQLAAAVQNQASLFSQLTSDINSAFANAQKDRNELRESNQGTAHALSKIVEQLTSVAGAISPNIPPPQPVGPAPSISFSGTDPASVPLPSDPSVEPVLSRPKIYDGDLTKCKGFIAQCELLFCHQSSRFTSDAARVALIVSLLGGRALDWAVAFLGKNTEFANNYSAFVSEFRLVFDHPSDGSDSASRLHSLSQGSRSVAEFAVEFRILAAGCNWGEEALMSAFRRGLSESIKDLILRDRPNTLASLISLALQVDDRLRERRIERSQRNPPVPRVPFNSRVQTSSRHDAPPQRSASPPPNQNDPEPMQLGRSRLTRAVREHRMLNKLCLYCGKSGHFVLSCGERPKDQAY